MNASTSHAVDGMELRTPYGRICLPALLRRDLSNGKPARREQITDLCSEINLRLILVSGKTKEFLFNPSESAGDIAQYVFDHWPHEWADEGVSKAEILRLIYQGRFLHGNVTLGALGLPTGKTCVMHLVPRENLPEPNSQDQRQKSKSGTSSCCSASCSIL